jgi:hypothetical protein
MDTKPAPPRLRKATWTRADRRVKRGAGKIQHHFDNKRAAGSNVKSENCRKMPKRTENGRILHAQQSGSVPV